MLLGADDRVGDELRVVLLGVGNDSGKEGDVHLVWGAETKRGIRRRGRRWGRCREGGEPKTKCNNTNN